eukprot:gene2195-2904_t
MYALRTYLKTRGIRIQHLFDEFDEDGIGALDALQFGRLARRLIPEARDEDVKYFQAMLDSDGEGHVTCEGLIDGLEELARLEVQNQGEVGQKDELKRVTAHLRQRPRDFERIAEGFEEYGHGYLSPREALWLVNEIVSDLSPNELRHLLARLKGVAAKDGYTTPGDLLYALRLDSTAALDLYRAEQADLPPAEYKKDSTWSLEVAMRDGHCFLVDRETSKVFSDIGDGRWPALYGRISAGDVVGAASTGLLEELVAVLRRGRQEFLEAFEFIQNNPDEALDASRVLRVIKRLVPMATEDDLQHFKAAAAFHRVQQFSLARFATLVERLRTAELERTAWASALEVDVLRQVAVLIDRHRFRVLEAYEQTWRVGNTRLHPYVYDNARYLLNPATGVVFQEPQIVGHMHSIDSPGADPSAPQMLTVSWTRSASPRPSPHSSYEASPRSPRPTTDFVDAMCKKLHVTALLMTGPTSPLCSLLSRFASPGKDHLTSAQLGDLVRAVMPGITSAKLRYLQVMMDEDGDGNVSFMELQDLFLTCKLLGKSLLLKNDVSVHDVILKMGKFMLYSDATPLELFQIFDLEDVGGLGRTQLQRLVRVFMPALDSEEAATLVSQWLAMKKDDLGKMMSHLAEMRRRAEQFKQLGSDAPQKKLRTSWDDVRFSKDRNGSQTKKSSNL